MNDDWIYRAMLDDNGKPKLGSSASALGIRPGRDVEVDINGKVHRPNFQPGGKNGLACAPSARQLPHFARPVKFGGGNTKLDVWRIRKSALGAELEAQQDGPNHISIGPATTMSLTDYIAAIQRTRLDWEKVT